MTLSTLLDKIAGRQQERREAHEADFRRLVVRIADGKEPDAEEIEHVLGANQKTIDDLRAAVELVERRRELRRMVDQVPDLEKERKVIVAEIAEATRIFKEATDKYDTTVEPRGARLKEINALTSDADRARHELYETCRDAELVSRLAEVERPLDELSRRLGSMEVNARNLRNEAEAERDFAKSALREPNANAHRKNAERCDAEAAELELQIPGLRQQVVKLTRQQAKIHKQMLEP